MENSAPQPLYLTLAGSKQWPIKDFQETFLKWTSNTLRRDTPDATINQITRTDSDLILIDIDLEDQSTLNLCSKLRTKGMTIPILALINTHQQQRIRSEMVELTCHQAGITDWQYWPLNEKQWLTWLNLWLPKREASLHYIKRLD